MQNDNPPGPPSGVPAHPRGLHPVGQHPPRPLLDALAEEHPEPADIDLRGLWHMLVKRRWLMLAITVAALLATLLLTLMLTPLYRATTELQIDNEEQHVVQVGAVGTQTGYDPDFLETQYQLLRSHSLAERVAAGLKLDAREAARLSSGGWRGALKRRNGAVGSQPVSLKDKTRLVQAGLTVEPVRNSRLVQVHFDSPDPAFSAQVANALAKGFIASVIERRIGASSYAKKYLEDQLKTVKAKLEASERQLVGYAQQEELVSTPEGQSLANQNLVDLNASLAKAQDQRIRAQARSNEAAAAGGAALPADMLANSIVRTLQEQRAQRQGEYQQKLRVFKPDYPEMLQIKGQIDELDRQIGAELGNIRGSVRAEYLAAQAQEHLLQGQLDSLRTSTLDTEGRSIDYNIIKREVDTNRQLYDSLLQRYKEVGVAGDVRSNNISVIDPAEVPTSRFKPSLSLNLAVGLLLGLLLAVTTAVLLEFLDDTIKSPDDVEQRLKLAVLGIIPMLSRQTPEQALADPRSAFAESYRSVRTALQFSTNHGIPRTLLVTSAVSSEGKTTTALTLARNLAEMGRRVLLIDGDLRNPSLHKLLSKPGQQGLSNYLAGVSTPEQAMIATDDPRLTVMLAGPLPPNPAELLSGPALGTLLQHVAERFDQVIIDGPPVMGIADAPILGNAADATILVVFAGHTRIASAQGALKRLHAARAHVIGGLLTQYDARAAGYGYKYEGYYAYGVVPGEADVTHARRDGRA